MLAVREGWSVEGQPFVVASDGEFEDRPDGVVCDDQDLFDHGLAHGLAGVGDAAGEDVPDAVADLGLIGRG